MRTTEIIVELVVIGMGWLIALILLSPSPILLFKQLASLDSAMLLIVVFVTTYVFGIIGDRLADKMFSVVERLIGKFIIVDPGNYSDAKSHVYEKLEHIREWSEYGRIRNRVVRGWVLNSIILIVVVSLNSFQNKLPISEIEYRFIYLLITVVFFGCGFSWYQITKTEIIRIEREHARLSNDNRSMK